MPKKCDLRKRMLIVLALITLLIMSVNAFSQSSDTALSGTVQDSSDAVLPGATVKATNIETNITQTTNANSAGIYNFRLQPGVYKVSAELAGFQTAIRTEVKLGVGGQIRLNFQLNVAGGSTEVEVTTTAQDLLLESSSSTGTVLQENSVTALPLASNDVMDLINIMGGVVRAEDPIFSNYQQTFAGVTARNINVQRDGMTVNDLRYDSGIISPQRINPEMVGEFKMILSPVDAELGRGAGQIQMVTKSGGNVYHGSGVWNVQNSALDANEWGNKRSGIKANWRNLNNYTITGSGPIIKNRTFFFASWDQQIVRARDNVDIPSLTPCARKGIYRYFDGWNNSYYRAPTSRTSGTQTRAVVDELGNPVIPSDNFDGTAYTGQLRFENVLGRLTDEARAQIALDPNNCSQYNFEAANHGLLAASAWDQYRTQYDTTGFVERFTDMMPLPTNYEAGDGLNVASHRWVRTLKGSDTVFGNGEDNQRKAITIKIDHNLTPSQRLGGRYTYENDIGEAQYQTWPNGYGGALYRIPQSFSVNLVSTLKPTLLNEFRFGLSRTSTHSVDALLHPTNGPKMKEILDYLMPTENFPNYAGFPLLVGPGRGRFLFSADTYGMGYPYGHPYGSRGALPTSRGGVDPGWSYSDTLTWTRGAHSFKGGFELRLQKSVQEQNGSALFTASANAFASVMGGNTSNSQPAGINWTGLLGTDSGNSSTGNRMSAYDLMSYMAGSVANVRQWYYTANNTEPYKWNDAGKGELNQVLDLRNKEYSFFFKDDWKINSALTLNLGLRYEFYGVPWVESGQTAALVGGPTRIWGVSGDGFESWMPVNPVQGSNSMLTSQQFVGPNSPNPDLSIFNKDSNNWGPAIGFAYQLPWFGKGKTTLRGGYQLSYNQLAGFDSYANLMGRVTGTTYLHEFTGDSINNSYLDMTDLPGIVPTSQFLDSAILPLSERPITERTQNLTVWDQNIRNPYTQSLNLSLTRNVGSNVTVDVRYVGTLSRKLMRTVNLNSTNFISNGLKDAFNLARQGQQSPLLNAIIPARSLTSSSTATGSDQVRTSIYTSSYLATGDYSTLARVLSTTNGRLTGIPSNVRGAVLRLGGAPENFILTNPQFSAASWVGNHNTSNYHSMQAQVTLRPIHGLSFQTSYTWSKNLGDQSTYTDMRDLSSDYGMLGSNRSHALSSYGTFTLPFGANGFLMKNATGVWKHVAEGWQLSWIFSATSGMPGSLAGTSMLWANGQMDQVGAFDPKSGRVSWDEGDVAGYFYGKNKYMKVVDPQCSAIHSSLQSSCQTRLFAIAEVAGLNSSGLPIAGDMVFQHPQPGTRGNFDVNGLTGMGRWSLDMAMGKTFEFMEGKSIDLRVDAQNIFNHPTPSNSFLVRNARFTILYNPNFSVNNADPFGYISAKGGHRTFQAKLRISF